MGFEISRLSDTELGQLQLPERSPGWMRPPGPDDLWTLERHRHLRLCALGGGWLFGWRGQWWWWEAEVTISPPGQADQPDRWRLTALQPLSEDPADIAAALGPPLRALRGDLYDILCARQALLEARPRPPVLQYAAPLHQLFSQVAPADWPRRLRCQARVEGDGKEGNGARRPSRRPARA